MIFFKFFRFLQVKIGTLQKSDAYFAIKLNHYFPHRNESFLLYCNCCRYLKICTCIGKTCYFTRLIFFCKHIFFLRSQKETSIFPFLLSIHWYSPIDYSISSAVVTNQTSCKSNPRVIRIYTHTPAISVMGYSILQTQVFGRCILN